MKTLVHLNEGTELVLNISYEETTKLIEESHDKTSNFIEVPVEKIIFNDLAENNFEKVSNVKLYIKRILFYLER